MPILGWRVHFTRRRFTMLARHLDGYRSCLRQDGFAALAVAGIAAVPAGRIVAAVAEVIVELTIERRFDHHLRQLRQQPTLTREPQPLGAGPLSQLPHQLVAGPTQLRPRRIQVHGSLLIVNHIGHRCLLLPQELHRKIYSPAIASGGYLVRRTWGLSLPAGIRFARWTFK